MGTAWRRLDEARDGSRGGQPRTQTGTERGAGRAGRRRRGGRGGHAVRAGGRRRPDGRIAGADEGATERAAERLERRSRKWRLLHLCADTDASGRERFACVYCGGTLTFETATIDHVWPRNGPSGGGGNGTKNTVTACHGCNRRKGSRGLDAFVRAEPAAGWVFLRLARHVHVFHKTAVRQALVATGAGGRAGSRGVEGRAAEGVTGRCGDPRNGAGGGAASAGTRRRGRRR